VNFDKPKRMRTHGDGKFSPKELKKIGQDVIFETGVMVFHPEKISIGNNVYIGHNSYIKGYFKNDMEIGDHTWIGQNCFLHSAGGLKIGQACGIGPYVKIVTSQHHIDKDLERPIIFNDLDFGEVVLKDGCDIGFGTIILPGVTIGEGAVIGAGSVVTKNIPSFEVWAGVPAGFIRKRKVAVTDDE
jgi:acetyltransferase-like isoleucine patch superfamily enzyme